MCVYYHIICVISCCFTCIDVLFVVVDCFNKRNQLPAAATAQGPNIASSEGDSNIAMMEHPISSTSPGPV